MIYILFFVLSALLLSIKNKDRVVCSDNRVVANQTTPRLISILIVVAFTLLAGLRDPSVGTDTLLYPYPVFTYALEETEFSHFLFVTNFRLYMSEYGYATFGYICAHTVPDFHFMLMMTALIINGGFMYFFDYHSRKYNMPIWLPWLFFCCMLFCQTMNLAKQSIAISLCLIAYVKWDQNKKIIPLILLGIALTFHFTSIAILIFFFERKIKTKWLRYAFVLILLSTVFGNYFFLSKLLSVHPLLIRFTGYLNRKDGDLAVFELLFTFILFFSMYFWGRPLHKQQIKLYNSFIYLFLIYISLFAFNYISTQAGRLGLYILPYLFVHIALFFQKSLVLRKFTVLLALFFIFYWYITIVVQGSTATYPYEIDEF